MPGVHPRLHKGQTSLAHVTFEAPSAASGISASFQGSTWLGAWRQMGYQMEPRRRQARAWGNLEVFEQPQRLPIQVGKVPDEYGHHEARSFVLGVGYAIWGWG